MKPCTRVGIDVTKRCNWRCQTCFYRYKADFNSKFDVPIEDVCGQLDAAKARGCDHAVLVGWGEPSLYPFLLPFFESCQARGMTSSIITNGTMDPNVAGTMYARGLNHLHVSVHGVGEVLDTVAGSPGAGARQARVLDFLAEKGLPWRSNTTMQKANYQQIPEIVRFCLERGVLHYVFLGFLPHYEWHNRVAEVAVHPAELRPIIEEGLRIIEEYNEKTGAGVMATVRYHPFCHLDQKYWKYIVNARYVLYDPWEWDYGHAGDDDVTRWRAATKEIGGAVSIETAPCLKCAVRMHCGGWNRVYAAGFDGAGLVAQPAPGNYVAGYYHDQNPANAGKGWF